MGKLNGDREARRTVLWLHNYYSRTVGMFMWDIFDNLPRVSWLNVDERSLPIINHQRDLVKALRTTAGLRHQFSLIHAQFGSLTGLMARLSGSRYIVSFRGSDAYPHPGSLRERLGGTLRGLFSRLAASKAAGIVVMSNAMRARILRWPGIAGKRVHILVDPVGFDFWPEGSDRLAEVMARTKLTVATASLFDGNPIKRLEIIRRAQELCMQIGLDVELLQIVGMERAAVREAMEQSDLFALASTHEGWPNVIKEALLLNLPFISTNVSDLAEYSLCRDKCRIVPPDPVDFAFAFIDAIVHKALAQSVRYDLIGFHPHSCALKHLALYAEYGAQ